MTRGFGRILRPQGEQPAGGVPQPPVRSLMTEPRAGSSTNAMVTPIRCAGFRRRHHDGFVVADRGGSAEAAFFLRD